MTFLMDNSRDTRPTYNVTITEWHVTRLLTPWIACYASIMFFHNLYESQLRDLYPRARWDERE